MAVRKPGRLIVNARADRWTPNRLFRGLRRSLVQSRTRDERDGYGACSGPDSFQFGTGPNRTAIASLWTGWHNNTFCGDLYMTADACTPYTHTSQRGWVYMHTPYGM